VSIKYTYEIITYLYSNIMLNSTSYFVMSNEGAVTIKTILYKSSLNGTYFLKIIFITTLRSSF
jgi:hypothetical protein